MRRRALGLSGCLPGLLLLATSCSGLKPLPAPSLPPCQALTDIRQLWTCLAEIPLGEKEESAFRSTFRVLKGDFSRKKADQKPGKACEGETPEGFFVRDRPAPGAGRAPLRAFYRAPDPGRPTILVVHGLYDSKRTRYVTLTARFLAEQGFGVLVPDMRWHGCLLSRDWLPSMGVEEGKDLVAWARQLREEEGSEAAAFGMIGYSLGALNVLHAIAEPEAPPLFAAGAIAVVPPADLERSLAHLDAPAHFADLGFLVLVRRAFHDWLERRTKNLGLAGDLPATFEAFLDWLSREGPFPEGTDAGEVLARADPAPKIRAARRPLLVITGGNDPVYPSAAAAALERAARSNPYARFIETPGGGHIGQLGLYPDWMAAMMTRFFRAAAGIPSRPEGSELP